MSAAVRKVPASKLFVSEPPPSWFGNPENPASGAGPGWTNDNWLKVRGWTRSVVVRLSERMRYRVFHQTLFTTD